MKFFDVIAPFYELFHLGSSRTADKIRGLVNFYNTDRILDLGGGTGRVGKHFINYVGQVFVADSSSAMIRRCQSRARLVCTLAGAESLPFQDNFFDKVIMVDAFHHFKDGERAVMEVKRILKPEGRVVVEEFNPRVFTGALIEKMESLLKLGSTFYAPESMKEFWEARGFEVELYDTERKSYYMAARLKI